MTRRVRLLLLAAVGAAMAFVLWRLDASAILRALADMSWRWAAAAALVNLGVIVLEASRWRFIVSAIRPVSLWSAWQALLVGMIGNLIFPLKLGEGARAYVMATRERLPPATALTTVLLDRVFDAGTLPLFVAIVSLLVPLPPSVLRFRRWFVAVVAVGVVAAGVARWWMHRRRITVAGLVNPPDRTIDRIIAGLGILDQRHRLASTIAAALCVWSARVAMVWCMFHAFDLDLPASAAVGTLALLNIGIAIVATPGNAGTFEFATAGALALWGVAPERGFSLGVAMHALEVVPMVVVGGAVIAWHRDLWPQGAGSVAAGSTRMGGTMKPADEPEPPGR